MVMPDSRSIVPDRPYKSDVGGTEGLSATAICFAANGC